MNARLQEATTPGKVLRRLRTWARRRAAVTAAVSAASAGEPSDTARFPDTAKFPDTYRSPAKSTSAGRSTSAGKPTSSTTSRSADTSASLNDPAFSGKAGGPGTLGEADLHKPSAATFKPAGPAKFRGSLQPSSIGGGAGSGARLNDADPAAAPADTALLVMANERLIVESLRAQVEAESALDALQEITRRAEHDPLTQLPNRVLLMDRFSQAIASAERHGSRLALLFLDLDGFKQINDTLGHATGDEVLKLVAQRLSSSVRKADTVSRHGGDEFLILLTEVSQPSDAMLIADKVRAALKAPARVGQHLFNLSTSIGISLYPDDGMDADRLIQQADAAMYDAKRRNDGGVQAAKPLRDLAAPATLRMPTRVDLLLADYEQRNERLVEENRRLTSALEKAQGLLSAAEQSRRREIEFMVVLAHDLCMPLASSHTTAAELERIGAEQPLLGQVQDNLDKHIVDINVLIHEAIEACAQAMATRQQHLSVHVPRRGPVVLGDPVRLAQALCNLLENASKYTQRGGRISISAITGKDRVELTVSDNGRGIDARILPGIFEPFVRGSNDTGPDGAGLGLGLTLVRQFVGAHGGQVAAKSAGEGRGSDFIVTLPLADSVTRTPPVHTV